MPVRTQLVHSHPRRHPERKEACLLAGVCRLAPVACLLAGVCKPHPPMVPVSSREFAGFFHGGSRTRDASSGRWLRAPRDPCSLSPRGSLQATSPLTTPVSSWEFAGLCHGGSRTRDVLCNRSSCSTPGGGPRFLWPAPAGPGCLTCDLTAACCPPQTPPLGLIMLHRCAKLHLPPV